MALRFNKPGRHSVSKFDLNSNSDFDAYKNLVRNDNIHILDEEDITIPGMFDDSGENAPIMPEVIRIVKYVNLG